MKKAVILVNAYTQLETELHQPLRLQEELQSLGVVTDVRRNNFFAAHVGQEGLISSLNGYDFCIYLDKDPYLSQMLEGCGMRLFNCARAIFDCDDKMQTSIRLAQAGIPVVKTFSSPLCYTPNREVPQSALEILERELGYPMVVKECYGSLGKGVFLAKNREELRAYSEKLKLKPHLYQKLIQESAGVDVRVIVVGGRAIAAMKRTSQTDDFRSNIELGGRGEAFALDDELKERSAAVAKALALDYCGIDFLFGKDGFLVCEVNSNAFFGGIERVTGVNVAREYATYVCMAVYGGVR